MDNEQSNLVDVLTKESLKRCWKKWGIDHTFDKINELCKNEAMKECFLRNYKELLKGK
jgi:hypothetical protein